MKRVSISYHFLLDATLFIAILFLIAGCSKQQAGKQAQPDEPPVTKPRADGPAMSAQMD